MTLPAPHQLDYAPPRQPRRYFRVVLPIAIALLILCSPFISVRQTRTRMDALTGSIETQTVWLGRFSSGASIVPSPLETRLATMNATPARNWRFLSNTHRTLYGAATCRECGSAPPISVLRPFIGPAVEGMSDQEVRDFVQILAAGSESEQRRTIDAVGDRALNSLKQ